MNDYAALRKKNTGRTVLWLIIAMLFVFELCAVSVLCSRIADFAPKEKRTVINLTEGGKMSSVEVVPRSEAQLPVTNAARDTFVSMAAAGMPLRAIRLPDSFFTSENPLPNADKTGFGVHDDDQVWKTVTDVEIFHLSYDNEKGETTVQTAKGDNVFAPGTESDYGFTITNTGKYNLTYYLTVESYYEGTTVDGEQLYIPIDARMYDYNGEYLVGTPSQWPDVLKLNDVNIKRVIAKGDAHDYTIQWRWPFERGELVEDGLVPIYGEDEYDTKLGNLAVDHDLILHVIIRTWAEIDEETTPPDTGDNANTLLWAVLAVTAMAAIILLLILLKREKKKEQNENAG